MASDLIYREDAKDFVRHAYHKGLNPVEYLDEVPAADVRPVVLCRVCEMASPCLDDREVYCTLNHCYKKKSYFCADGREKNENSN